MINGSFSNTPDGSRSRVDPPHESSDTAHSFSFNERSSKLFLECLVNGFHTTSILVCSPEGKVLFANRIASNAFPGYTPDSVISRNLTELTPKPWALERIKYMELAVERDRPLTVLEILGGSKLSSTMSPIKLGHESPFGTVLLITVETVTPLKLRWLRSTRDPEDLIDADVIDLGRLSVLTPRELEVLALMGEGHRQKQIAEMLHRSVSTIDRHRERIGDKLGITDRIELVGLAREAALEVSDATRTNISFRKDSDRPKLS